MSLQYALLGLLSGGPMNGYAIKGLFDEAISHVWQAGLSQIYRELGSLEKKGWLSSWIEQQSDRPNKRMYQATEEGKRAFFAWLATVPDSFDVPNRDEFMLRIFFGSVAGRDIVVEEFRRYIAHLREADARGSYSRLAERFPGDPLMLRADRMCREDLYCGFLHRRAELASEAALKWAEECLAALEAMEKKIDS